MTRLHPEFAAAQGGWAALFPPGLIAELEGCSFVRDCRAGSVPMPAMKAFLVQHQHYSQHFVRYLCAVMSSLPEAGDIRALMLNLIEELGLDAPERVTHAELYRQTMQCIGVQPGSAPVLPATQDLIDTMFRHCRSGDPLLGLSAMCLGAEALVPTLYGAVLQGLRKAGLSKTDLYFFELHVQEDEAHALAMRQQLEQMLQHDPRRLKVVHQVATDMVRCRVRMLEAAYAPFEAHTSYATVAA